MTTQVKFTPFGMPYITEFENVSFVPDADPTTLYSLSSSPSSSTSSFCYIETPPQRPRFPSLSLQLASSFFKRKNTQHATHAATIADLPIQQPSESEDTKPLPPPPHSDAPETCGIYIQLPPEHICPQMTRKQRLVHLQQTISFAVLGAGMRSSPANSIHPVKHSNEVMPHRAGGYKTPNSLFCGTYGQLMSALESAGLSATPCMGKDLSGHTRLGALFVARNDGTSGVQLKKITLWG